MPKANPVFQSNIVQKFMSAAEFQVFLEKYYANRGGWGTNSPRVADENDKNIYADLVVNKLSMKEMMKKYSVSQ